MPRYTVSQTHFFRENGLKVEAGEEVELSEQTFDEYQVKHPGLLRPVRQNTQGSPHVVRSETPRKRTRKKS